MKKIYIVVLFLFNTTLIGCKKEDRDLLNTINPEDKENWELYWADEFNYTNRVALLKIWESQNGPSGHILSSRWEENIEVENGTLKLVAHKETRGGQNWTAGSIWTKEKFQYGYFECRYKYAAATGTNNSFWLMDINNSPSFEIDINEGHYPNEANTNIHKWTNTGEIESSSPVMSLFDIDFSKEYHLFGVEWDQDNLIFYFDRKEFRKEKNIFCFSSTPILLSLAIMEWAGTVTDEIDGKFMEIDYVRIYSKNIKITK